MEPILSEKEQRWLLECIRVYTIGSVPSYKDIMDMSEEKREFYFEFAKNYKEIEEMKLAMLCGNFALGAALYDYLKPPLSRSMETMIKMSIVKEKRKLEEG